MEARRLRLIAPVLALTIASAACVDGIVGPGYSRTDVAIRTTDAIVWREISSVTDFRVDVELTNLGPNWVEYDRWCGWRIDQLVNSRWEVAYRPLCSVHNSEYYWIPPGATYYESLPAHASWRRIGGPITGTYQVVFEMFEDVDGRDYVRLREDRTASNSFTVR